MPPNSPEARLDGDGSLPLYRAWHLVPVTSFKQKMEQQKVHRVLRCGESGLASGAQSCHTGGKMAPSHGICRWGELLPDLGSTLLLDVGENQFLHFVLAWKEIVKSRLLLWKVPPWGPFGLFTVNLISLYLSKGLCFQVCFGSRLNAN